MSLDRVSHAELLYSVISLQLAPAGAEDALSGGRDLELAVAVVTQRDLSVVLERFVGESMSATEVAEWADFLELRDDVDYDLELVKEVVHELANPVLEGALTQERARILLAALAER